MSWHNLKFNGKNEDEINLNLTLRCGQAFRWQNINDEWRCGFNDFVIRLKQNNDCSVYFFSKLENHDKIKSFLNDYFRCNESLTQYSQSWKISDNRFESVFNRFKGIRLLRQSPVENLFSFICSSNNNIARISKLVSCLATTFGTANHLIDEANGDSMCYPSFPSIDNLCTVDCEQRLRGLGFGYRSKYICESAKSVQRLGGERRLIALRLESFEDARAFLLSLHGVGPKVADCVLLGSLDQPDSVPIDIHMFHVAKQHYRDRLDPATLGAKTVTGAVSRRVKALFNDLWQPQSGWAQMIVFASDLKQSRFAGSALRVTEGRRGTGKV